MKYCVVSVLLSVVAHGCATQTEIESSYSLADEIDARFDAFLRNPQPAALSQHALSGGLAELLEYQQPALNLSGNAQENFNQWVHTAWIATRLFGTAPFFKMGQFAENAANSLLRHLGLSSVDFISDNPLGETFLAYTRLQEIPPYDQNDYYCGVPGLPDCPEPTERPITHGPGYSWATTEQFHIAGQGSGAWLDLDRRNQGAFIEGRECPLVDDGVLLMMEQVIVEEWRQNNIAPTIGQFHTWAHLPPLPPALDFYDSGSKLLSCLAVGCTSKYLVTGQEEALSDWLMSEFQPGVGGNKANLEQVFRYSYRLNDGNIYLTLMTIENVLSHYWLDMDRNGRQINQRLQPVTAVYRDRGDKFGAWYHFIGAMIASFYSTQETWNEFILFMEDASSRFLYSEGDEFQENCINHTGGQVGYWLRQDMDRHLNRGARTFENRAIDNDDTFYAPNPAFVVSADNLRADRWLNLDQDYRGRIEVYTAPELSARLATSSDGAGTDLQLTSRVRGLRGCTVDIFLPDPERPEMYHMGRGSPVDLPRGQEAGLRVDGVATDSRFRVFVSSCTSDDTSRPFEYPLAFDSACPTLLDNPTVAVPACPAGPLR